jgi:hypothetical protein
MFSIVERATSRTLVRVLVIVMAAALLCGSFSAKTLAVQADRRPCEYPGDGEGVGGYKGYEFEGVPSSVTNPQCSDPRQPKGHGVAEVLRVSLTAWVIEFYLAMRK